MKSDRPLSKVKLWLVLALFLSAGCTAAGDPARQIQTGQTMKQVRAAAGVPDHVSEFILPAEPFFGPQESLAELLPAGTRVEEWQYESRDVLIYVWFVGGEGQPREEWTVVDTAAYPADAVF
jgi:hypothetical protein